MSLTLPEALRRLHAAGRIASPWPAYLLLQCRQHPDDPEDTMRLEPGTVPEWPGAHDFDVRTDDPATVGVLTALLREAMGRPTLCMDVHWGNVDGRGISAHTRWCVGDPADDWEGPRAVTEGEAVAQALIRLAEEVAP